jgi:hypothetical protein
MAEAAPAPGPSPSEGRGVTVPEGISASPLPSEGEAPGVGAATERRYDDPGRNGLGKFAAMGFGLMETAPADASATDSVVPKDRRGPEAFTRLIAPSYLSPEQTILAFFFGGLVLAASIGFWLFIYLRNADEFHIPSMSAVPVQTRLAREREAAEHHRAKP